MSECPEFREALAQTVPGIDGAPGSSPGIRSDPAANKYFAYNQTRERFLSVDVEAADFSSASLDTRLAALTPDCGSALWILPFRGISPTSVRVPIDLVFLDRNRVVLDAVESYPISQAAPSCVPAASLLALPANTISVTGTSPGDRLLLCSPDEAKWSLPHVSQAKAIPPVEQSLVSGQDPASGKRRLGQFTTGKVLHMADRSDAIPSHERSVTENGEVGYASDGRASLIRVFDRRTFQVTAKIPLPAPPRALAFEPQTGLLFAFGALPTPAPPPRNSPRPSRGEGDPCSMYGSGWPPPPAYESLISIVDPNKQARVADVRVCGVLGAAQADGNGEVYFAIGNFNEVGG